MLQSSDAAASKRLDGEDFRRKKCEFDARFLVLILRMRSLAQYQLIFPPGDFFALFHTLCALSKAFEKDAERERPENALARERGGENVRKEKKMK